MPSFRLSTVSLALIVCGGMWATMHLDQPCAAAIALRQAVISESDEGTERQIRELVSQLSSTSYASRQAATEQLWQFGNAAKPALEQAVQSGDNETSKRAAGILSVLALGIDANTSPEIAKLILEFNAGEESVKRSILSRLVVNDSFQLAFDLLEQVKDLTERRSLYLEGVELNGVLIRLADNRKWDDIEFLLQHPVTLQCDPSSAILYHQLQGSIAARLASLRAKVDQRISDGVAPDPLDLGTLMAASLFLGRFSDAEQLAELYPEDNEKIAWQRHIRLERGDWKAIAQRMIDPNEVVPAGSDQVNAPLATQALVHYFAKDQAAFSAKLDQLQSELDRQLEDDANSGQAKESEKVRELRNGLLKLGLITFDWALVEANLDMEEADSLFGFLIEHQRIESAFAAIGLGETVADRNIWMARKLRNLRSLKRKRSRVSSDRQLRRQVDQDINQASQLVFQVTGWLARMGLTDEATLHCHTLFAAFDADDESPIDLRGLALGSLVEMGRQEDAWRLFENSLRRSDLTRMASSLFNAEASSRLNYWDRLLKSRYPEPLVRYQVIAGLLNSPTGRPEDFDLNVELAWCRSDANRGNSHYLMYEISRLMAFHEQPEASRQYLNIAADLGNSSAREEIALEAWRDGDVEPAVSFFEQGTSYRNRVRDACMLAELSRVSGDTRVGNLRKCVAFAHWLESYNNAVSIAGLKELGYGGYLADFIKLQLYPVMTGLVESSDRYRDELCEVLAESNPAESLVHQQIAIFKRFDTLANPTELIQVWLGIAHRHAMQDAKQLIAEQRFDEALALLKRVVAFSPGDPSVGEEMCAAFDAAGATQHGDELFARIAEFYYQVLQQYPDSSLHHNNFAWICVCAKRNREYMLRHAQKAVKERPHNPSYLDTLAAVHFELGDTEQAIATIRRCLSIAPSRRNYQEQLRKFQQR